MVEFGAGVLSTVLCFGLPHKLTLVFLQFQQSSVPPPHKIKLRFIKLIGKLYLRHILIAKAMDTVAVYYIVRWNRGLVFKANKNKTHASNKIKYVL